MLKNGNRPGHRAATSVGDSGATEARPNGSFRSVPSLQSCSQQSRKDSLMPAILDTLARLAARLSGRQSTLRITGDARIVRRVGPMIERLIADTPDGEVYQTALAELFVGERPP